MVWDKKKSGPLFIHQTSEAHGDTKALPILTLTQIQWPYLHLDGWPWLRQAALNASVYHAHDEAKKKRNWGEEGGKQKGPIHKHSLRTCTLTACMPPNCRNLPAIYSKKT